MSITKILENLVTFRSLSRDRDANRDVLNHITSVVTTPMHDKQTETLWWGHKNLATTEWLIQTHVDVVPANDDQFNLKVIRNKAWGRGAADTKGSAAVLMKNAHNWEDVAHKKKITFMVVTDEEIGGESTQKILGTMKHLKGAIFLEPTGLKVTTKAKGMMQVKISASGRAVHGSLPWTGSNAIEKLALGLTKFRLTVPQPTQETRFTTYNFSQINGGTAINQVPACAELWCDIRRSPEEDPQNIVSTLSASFNECDIRVIKNESPIMCDTSSHLFQSLKIALKANNTNPLTGFDHGTSDARHATALGIPALVFGPKGGNLHAIDEWVSLKSLKKVEAVLDHWVNNI